MKQKKNMMLIIEPKRDAVLMFPKNGSTLELEEAQNIVGGYIEVVGVLRQPHSDSK